MLTKSLNKVLLHSPFGRFNLNTIIFVKEIKKQVKKIPACNRIGLRHHYQPCSISAYLLIHLCCRNLSINCYPDLNNKYTASFYVSGIGQISCHVCNIMTKAKDVSLKSMIRKFLTFSVIALVLLSSKEDHLCFHKMELIVFIFSVIDFWRSK